MEQFIATAFSILLHYFRMFTMAKRQLIAFIEPITYKFDIVEILIIWTIVVVVTTKILARISYARKHGVKRTLSTWLFRKLKKFGPFARKVEGELNAMSKNIEADIAKARDEQKTLVLPQSGLSEEAIRNRTKRWFDIDYKIYGKKKITGSLYYAENEKLFNLVKDIAKDYMYINPLHFDLFPTANQMEGEVISMTKNLYNGDDKACGILTSGGTESIMIAMLAYREWGRDNGIFEPEIVAPITAHVAFEKAAFYYGMIMKWIPINMETGMVEPRDIEKAINKNTVCVVGSFPNYPYGTVDPIHIIAEIARKHKIGFHTDCCLGGFIAPFAEKLGVDIQPFDFRVPGVTSISADPHKYGMAPKGVSVVMFRDVKLRGYSFFSSTTWPGGIYVTPTHAGSRGHAPVAGAWVAMNSTGYNGYFEKARAIIDATKKCVKKLGYVKEIQIVGNPELGVVSFISKDKNLSCYEISVKCAERGWKLAALQLPPALHLSITNYNLGQIDDFIETVKWAVGELIKNPPKKKSELAQIYGSAAQMPESLMQDGTKVLMNAILKP